MSVFVSAKAGQYSNTGFADYLFYQGDYYRAIGEYKRYIYSNEKSSNIETAYFMIAKSYLLANKTEQAREAFDYIVQNYEGEYVKKSVIGKILSLSMGEEYEYSNILCKTHSEILDISQCAYLQGINYLSLNDWVGSKIEFEKVQKENELYNSASEMVKYLEGYGGVPQKSEILAGILGAVLPGSGYLYCERYADSLVAFTINAILAYNLYNSINNHDTTGTVLYGISGAVMYTTNITGGITAAGKFNRDKKEEFKKNALELKVDLIKFFLP
jgi:tetratricopeptide (TPR) repeat protein